MLFAIMEIDSDCKIKPLIIVYLSKKYSSHLDYITSLVNMLVIKSIHSLLLLALTASGSRASLSTFFLSDNIVGADFYQHFDWEALPDPSHGRV